MISLQTTLWYVAFMKGIARFLRSVAAAGLVVIWPPALSAQVEEVTPAGDAALNDGDAQNVEQELVAEIPLAPIGDPKRIEQLWHLAGRLTKRRAYCRAAKYLTDIEILKGATLGENKSAAAQTFYMCARTRLTQGDVAAAAQHLARSTEIVGERPEHRDLRFKLALVRAKAAMKTDDIAAIREGLEEARKLGIDMGPGSGERLATWAVPVINDAVSQISAWSHELLRQEKRELADQASKLAIEYNPRDKIAHQVQRDLILGSGLITYAGIVLGGILLIGMLWRFLRWTKMRKVVAGLDFDDDVDAV